MTTGGLALPLACWLGGSFEQYSVGLLGLGLLLPGPARSSADFKYDIENKNAFIINKNIGPAFFFFFSPHNS